MDPQTAQPIESSGGDTKKVLIALVVIFGVVILGVIGLLLFKGEATAPGPKIVTGLPRDSITIAQVVPFAGVFPNSTGEFNDAVFNNNIFEGLGKVVNGKVKPALASSWTNPSNTTWRFNLRKGVKFHNGDSLTASDVKFSIDQSIKNEWPNSFNLSTVKSVTVVDDNTIDIKTTSPDPVLLNRLVYAFVVSEKQFKERKKGEEAVGTGPYKYVSLDKKSAVLEANPAYYGSKPRVKKIVYKFFADDITDKQLVISLKKGEVDLVKLSDEKVSKSVGSGFQVKTLSDPFISFLWLDAGRNKSPYVSKTPNPLKNKSVRQAIYKTIDVNNVIKEASISATPASQMVTEAIFGYNPNTIRPKQSIEEAKSLMKQAGVESGFTLTIDTPGYLETMVKTIAADLAKIGIKVKVNSIASRDEAFTKWFGTESNSYYQDASAFIQDWGAETYDAGEIFTSIVSSTGENNYLTFGYLNNDIDKLAGEITSTYESKARLAKLQNAMVKTMEETPMIPLYSQKFYYVTRNNFDWTPTAFGGIYGNEITGREVSSN